MSVIFLALLSHVFSLSIFQPLILILSLSHSIQLSTQDLKDKPKIKSFKLNFSTPPIFLKLYLNSTNTDLQVFKKTPSLLKNCLVSRRLLRLKKKSFVHRLLQCKRKTRKIKPPFLFLALYKAFLSALYRFFRQILLSA